MDSKAARWDGRLVACRVRSLSVRVQRVKVCVRLVSGRTSRHKHPHFMTVFEDFVMSQNTSKHLLCHPHRLSFSGTDLYAVVSSEGGNQQSNQHHQGTMAKRSCSIGIIFSCQKNTFLSLYFSHSGFNSGKTWRQIAAITP